MYRRGYRPSIIQRQQNADRYDAAVTQPEKYRKHVDPTSTDKDGRNAVHLSVLMAVCDSTTDHCDAGEAALDRAVQAGCDPGATDHWGLRPIHYAAQLAPVGILRRLLRYGVDPNALTTPGDKTDAELEKLGQWGRADLSPLMLAAVRGHEEAIRVLLKNGAKATLTNSRKETALHYAAATPVATEECIVALVGQQPGSGKTLATLLNVQDCDGSTALIFAAKNKSSSSSAYAVRALIGFGADVLLADCEGRTALHWAAQCNQPEVIDILARANADLDVTDKEGDTAYVKAIKSNSSDALQHLISAGCDRTSIDGLMGTAVALAAVKDHAQIIEILVKNGDDPDEFGYFGKTPIMLAAYESNLAAVEMLLKVGADPNVLSRTGCTTVVASLLRASATDEVKRHGILVSLIRAGVNVNPRGSGDIGSRSVVQNYFKAACSSSSTRNWPLSYAMDTGYVSLVRILLLAGSVVPVDEVRDQQTTTGKFFDSAEILAPIEEWTSQPPSLQYFSRMVIRHAISDGKHRCEQKQHFNFGKAISSLPVAERLKAYIDFADLDGVRIQRARVLNGAEAGMIQMRDSAPCGLKAIMGKLNPHTR